MAVRTRSRKKNSSLAKRAKISHSTKDQGGGGSRVINFKDIDGEVQFFQPAVGKNAINIIPFEIKSKNHPLVKQGQMEIGELDYCLDIWTHRNVGPSESSVICLKKTYGKACPICEEVEKMKKAGKEKEAAALLARRRVFYNVEDTRRKPGELQVFEVSHYLFEKELIDEARNDEDGEDSFVDFADPETGSVIRFRCSKETKGGFEFNEFKSFSFAEREDPIDDELLASAISFDEYLNVQNYEQIQAILFGADEDEEDEEDEEDKPASKKAHPKKPVKEIDDDEDSEDDDEDEETPIKKPGKKTSSMKGIKRKAVEEEDEEEENEKPVKKSSVKKDDKPVKKSKCPHGHTFGSDADGYEDCEDCVVWKDCVAKSK
jgi:hypothetical protein